MNTFKIISNLLLINAVIIGLSSCSFNRANPEITTEELTQHISYLASDSLKGRYPGEGAIPASEYISEQLVKYGATPLFDNGMQAFTVVTGTNTGDNNMLIINADTLELGTDYMPLSFSENTSAEGNMTFAGYGFSLDMDELKWDDYKNIDVQGKWVLMLRNDPEPDNMMSEFIPFAKDRAKVTLAKDKGAIGVLLVNGMNSSKKDQVLELSYDQNLSDAGLPVISITRSIVNNLLNGKTIEDLEKEMIEGKKPIAFATDHSIIGQTHVVQETAEARNVVYEIKSKAKPNTEKYMVIGAHYDHLGMGGESVNSRMPDTVAVHNGADDNASGVAGIIELAGWLNNKADSLQQHVIVVAFDGEEMGILGSKYFLENPPVNKDNFTAMFNFDMIGRMKSDSIGISIGGTGTAIEFDSLLNTHTPYFGVTRNKDGYGPSDHAPFYSNDIPVLFFSTGAHIDYHTPLDDIEKLDIAKEKDILDYAGDVFMSIASKDDTLSFQSTGSAGKGSRRTRLKVTLGIIPDVAGVVKNGLGIDGVRKGGPAEKGGIIKGDKITAINGDAVTNIYDYMFRLSKLKPETTAIVEVERNGQKEVLLIRL